MTQAPTTILVQAFRVYGGNVESPDIAAYKTTPEAIRRLGGEPIQGSEEDVDPAELDALGRYRRVATGWGELQG